MGDSSCAFIVLVREHWGLIMLNEAGVAVGSGGEAFESCVEGLGSALLLSGVVPLNFRMLLPHVVDGVGYGCEARKVGVVHAFGGSR